MNIQVLTAKDKPMIEVADDATASDIDEAIRKIYGVQSNANPHDWIGDPDDLICKQWEELQRINMEDAEFYLPDAARDSEETK